MTLDHARVGASVSMTPAEVDELAGDGPVRLVTCPDGRVIGGMGCVGFAEHVDETDLLKFIDTIKAKREDLAKRAKDPVQGRAVLYTFIRI